MAYHGRRGGQGLEENCSSDAVDKWEADTWPAAGEGCSYKESVKKWERAQCASGGCSANFETHTKIVEAFHETVVDPLLIASSYLPRRCFVETVDSLHDIVDDFVEKFYHVSDRDWLNSLAQVDGAVEDWKRTAVVMFFTSGKLTRD
ncbi:hypothetical protein Scep_021725 [Stephania cephalantha]|uniref:Uncharacterized protein n=1 Tax=Stephania cephalantha TaxID=152367 RepID=A0AAP0I1M0_9MAGN